MTTVTQFEYIYYGTQCDADEVKRFLTHNLDANVSLETRGQKKTPVCIWGRHGIGKTQIVQDVAKQRSAAFVSIAPAQFEEMGDLLGMPTVEAGGKSTKMAAPSWVPREPGPGILLIDDVNRADDRILRGMMQLLQAFPQAAPAIADLVAAAQQWPQADKVAKRLLRRSQRLHFYLDYVQRDRLNPGDKERVRRIVKFFEGRE